ncbi:hypothetical protein PAMA_018142 [Pampus argenteus]
MKLTTFSVLCLLLLLFHAHFSLAVTKTKKPPTTNRGSTHSSTGNKNNQGTNSQGKQPNQRDNNQQPGRPEYPQQPSGGRNQPPTWNFPYGGHYGGRGRQGGRGYQGGYGGHGHNRYDSYPGGYINQNPNNKILSPRYGSSYEHGGHRVGGGSPFSQAVQKMNVGPNEKSKGFGRTAVKLAAGGAIAGMALGYGLGRFPRPHFRFNSSQEEYYYNYYMYRKYGVKSTNTNNYNRNYRQPPQTYENYMDSCMKRKNILSAENRKQNKKTVATNTTTTANVTSAPDADTGSNVTETNNTVAKNSSTSAPSTPHPLNQPKASPVPPASQADNSTENDDDVVSVVEIGYPALIEQLKVRRCLEQYMLYSEKYFKSKAVRVRGLEMGLQGLLAVVSSTLVMLLTSNMLTLIH